MSNEYSVYFSFYSEQFGDFEDTVFKVNADNQFEARRRAWALIDTSGDMKFASNIKLCGVTWNASPLDMQDYFNAEAAYEKYQLKHIENVDIPNARLNNNEDSLERYGRDKYEHYGCLQTIFRMATDFGRPHGMLPPTIYDELHYAREFLMLLEGCEDFEKYNAFLREIEKAEKWDSAAIYDIRESFRSGHFSAGEFELDFSAQLGKNGLCPTRADLTESDYTYIRRHHNAREYNSLDRLPVFNENDIITGGDTLQFDWQTLVLNMDALEPEHRNPVNSLWIANQDSPANFDRDGYGIIAAENPFTGEISAWKRTDFLGVLRPEKTAKINYETIKNQYMANLKTAQTSLKQGE